MTKQEILAMFRPYLDQNGLYSSNPTNDSVNTSGNGVMYTSEVAIIVKKNSGEIDPIFVKRFSDCLKYDMLNRYPFVLANGSINFIGQSQEGPDDYIGLANACIELNETSIPRRILKSLIKYFGFLNNVQPGKLSASSFLARFPWLIAGLINASFPSKTNVGHYLVRLLAFPLYFISALYIAKGGLFIPTEHLDSRRLCWHTQNNLKKTSLFCYLASKIWVKRLYKQYPRGMKDVAAQYYDPKPINAFAHLWVTE